MGSVDGGRFLNKKARKGMCDKSTTGTHWDGCMGLELQKKMDLEHIDTM